MISLQARVLRLFFHIERMRHPPAGDLDLTASRVKLERLARQFASPDHVERSAVSAGSVPGEWLTAADVDPGKVILYLHGGYCNAGSLSSHRHLAARIARASGASTLTIDYRLTPEDPFPPALDDSKAAYEWLLGRGIAPHWIVITGDSAGGGLAVATLVALRDAGSPLPASAVCHSPWTDLTVSGESIRSKTRLDLLLDPLTAVAAARLYLNGADPQSPLASPIYADLSGLLPLLIQVGSDEILLSDAEQLALRAEVAGVAVALEVWEEMQHVWQYASRFVPEGRRAVEWIGEFCAGLWEAKR